VEGEAGDFRVTLKKKPRYIDEDKCTGCTSCVEYCPVQYPDKFNQEISLNKAVHVYFSQAIPLITYIDDSCLYLKEKKCGICKAVCKAGAVDFTQETEKIEVRVGSVVLSPGIEPFDPNALKEYRYGEFANVVTSMDYERLLCATGPYQGEVLRGSDQKHPKNLAWIQCVGSRQVREGANSYCSSVCCTYTQKQVILTKEHDADAACTVFHNDIRSYGKDFERYYQKTAELPGVRFFRSYVSIAREDPETKNVTIRYSTPDEGVKEEEFDMVVLSVGLNPPEDARGLARTFGVELNDHGFSRATPANPMETSRPGVFVSGAFQGPTDIPESVFTASAAGSQVGEFLDYRRGKLAVEREYPLERDVSAEEPRIGVFVCHCGANIGRIVGVPSTVEYVRTLPNVVHAQEQLFSCATNSAKEITDVTREKGLNRVVVAACSPRTLEALFRDTVREAGINPYYCEMANIREHCSWVHAKEKESATEKAKDIIRMAVARAAHLEPLQEFDLPVNKAALVVGGGVAGMTTALSIAEQGHEVWLLEKEAELGGTARRIHSTLAGMDVQAFLTDLVGRVHRHPLVHVATGATIAGATGYVGNFVTRVKARGRMQEIRHGVTVLATGAEEHRPTEYLYGEDDRVMTQLEVEGAIAAGDERVLGAQAAVMVQCVGCRQPDRNYCARICCGQAVKNALSLKAKRPQMDIYILFRDMRTYGFSEDYYREAAGKDVKFIRYEPENKPVVRAVEEGGRSTLRVVVDDPVLGTTLAIDADLVALSAAVVPREGNRSLAQLFQVALSPDDFFKEAHVKLRPVEFSTDGVYLCGTAHYPKNLQETINQAYGAAGRAVALLSHDTVVASGSVCEVEENKCISCGECVSACSYGAVELRETGRGKKACVNPVLCKGDGLCNAVCPTGAISLKHFTDEEFLSQIDAAVGE
jgi:heterodisulfide reductase subunit A